MKTPNEFIDHKVVGDVIGFKPDHSIEVNSPNA